MGDKITDSELIKLLLEEGEVKSQTELGVILGMKKSYARTYLSNVKNGDKDLALKYRLMIIQIFPEFSDRHKLNRFKKNDEIIHNIEEPNSKYSNNQKDEHMNNLEQKFNHHDYDILELKTEMKALKLRIKELEDINQQSVKAV